MIRSVQETKLSVEGSLNKKSYKVNYKKQIRQKKTLLDLRELQRGTQLSKIFYFQPIQLEFQIL